MLFVLLLLTCVSVTIQKPTPVVLWHGMGDTCCGTKPLNTGDLKKTIEANVPGIYVLSLMIGNNTEEDRINGFYLNANDQISIACSIIKQDVNLQNGYHIIGFSQGGILARGLAQRCPSPPILNMLSFGGQQQGIHGPQKCAYNVPQAFCKDINETLSSDHVYDAYTQHRLVQAEIYHDPLKEEEYREKNIFLADINQERAFNQDYKTNILKLKNMVLVWFTNDTVSIPSESEWFGFYVAGQTKELYDLESSPLYKNDTLGLRTLDRTGRLHKLAVAEDHLVFTNEWFINEIIKKFII